jgi:hypothetical protein
MLHSPLTLLLTEQLDFLETDGLAAQSMKIKELST